MIRTFPAVILECYDTGETSGMLHTFSGMFGRLSVMAKGLRDPKKRLAGILQPLSTVELTVSVREGAETATLRDASLVDDRARLRGDLERLALGSLLAETASESCDVSQASEEMFALLEDALATLDPARSPSAPVAAAEGLLAILMIAGYEPHLDESLLQRWPAGRARPLVFWLDVEHGRVHLDGTQPLDAPTWPMKAHALARQVPVPPSAVRFVYSQTRRNEGEAAALPAGEAIALVDALARLAQRHLEHPLRSLRFWRDVTGLGNA